MRQIRYAPVDSPSVLPLPQPLTLSHILGKARLREIFKAIGKWSGEECAPLTEVPQAQPAAATKQVNGGGCLCCVCVRALDKTHSVSGGQHYGKCDSSSSCFVHHNSCEVPQRYHGCCHNSSYHGDGRKRQVGEFNADHNAKGQPPSAMYRMPM